MSPTAEITPYLLKRIIAHRRALHQIPELGFQETKTQHYIMVQLESLGLTPFEVAGTGVVAVLKGEAGPGPCIGLRADMDGLPIQEENDLPFASTHPGKMHACGHDGHMAIMLGVVEALVQRKNELTGHIKFIFQPGEEGYAGAKSMVEAGVLEIKPAVDAIFGAHLWTYQPVGEIGVRTGPTMAAADEFHIHIRGKGGHGVMPQGTVDAVLVAAQLTNAIHTIVSRTVDPLENAVITVGTMHSGANFNVIAETAELTGTVRAYKEDIRQHLKQRLQAMCAGIGATFGAEIVLNYQDGYPPTVNAVEPTDRLRQAASRVVGAEKVVPPYLTMAGEDMAYFLQEKPGCFFFIGAGKHSGDQSGKIIPHHCPVFDFDEAALGIGAGVFIRVVESYLGK